MAEKPDDTPLTPLHELTESQVADFFARLTEKTRSTTRDGKPFYACKFADARRTAAVMVWRDSRWFADCERDWQAGEFYKVRGAYQEDPRFGPQLEIRKIRPVNDADREQGFDESHFQHRSRFDPDEMFAELCTLVAEHVADEPLRAVVIALLDRHADAIRRLPGSPRHYYPFVGGWLEHTLSVVKNCLWLTERYAAYYQELQPPLNRDLVVAAAALHEIGRVSELEPTEPFDTTVEGELFGRIALGRDLLRDAVREQDDLDPELARLLEHILHSYLTLPEWGSPRLPLIPEVLILHHADDLDAKLEMYVRCLSRDASDGPFTGRDPALGKHLYRGREV